MFSHSGSANQSTYDPTSTVHYYCSPSVTPSPCDVACCQCGGGLALALALALARARNVSGRCDRWRKYRA